MEREERLTEKLEKWVDDNPEDADVLHINLTTQKEFTIRGILNQLTEARDTGAAIVDEEVLEITGLIEEWIGG